MQGLAVTAMLVGLEASSWPSREGCLVCSTQLQCAGVQQVQHKTLMRLDQAFTRLLRQEINADPSQHAVELSCSAEHQLSIHLTWVAHLLTEWRVHRRAPRAILRMATHCSTTQYNLYCVVCVSY